MIETLIIEFHIYIYIFKKKNFFLFLFFFLSLYRILIIFKIFRESILKRTQKSMYENVDYLLSYKRLKFKLR